MHHQMLGHLNQVSSMTEHTAWGRPLTGLLRERAQDCILEMAGYERGLDSMEPRHLGMGLMTQDLTRCLLFRLQGNQNCFQVVGPTTDVTAEMLVLVSQACEVAEVGHSV